jgi:DNA-directed RNA polymerase specialized sigma24 family protein
MKFAATTILQSWIRGVQAWRPWVKSKSDSGNAGAKGFGSTQWNIVLTAAQDGSPEVQAALGEILDIYWYPIYSQIRGHGYNREDAQDLTQGFFLHLLEHRGLRHVDPQKGKFRSFLLASLQNYLSVAENRQRTLKRGGQYTFVSFDTESFENRYLMEPADKLALTGEQIFDARCALALLNEATANVRAHYVRRDKARTFELLKGFLTSNSTEEFTSYHEAALALRISDAAVATFTDCATNILWRFGASSPEAFPKFQTSMRSSICSARRW